MNRPIKHFLRWVVSGVIAVTFLLVMSSATSFFNTVYGGDAAIFRVIGSAMHHGQELYVGVWDHKGPTLFFIEWLGQVIHEGRGGIFVLQVVALTVSLALIMTLALRFTSRLGAAGAVTLVIAVLSFTFEGGNLSEEFSLPLIVFVLYGALRLLDDDETAHGVRGLVLSAGMGVAFAFTFFTRANNAMPIAGIFAGLLIQLLLRRAPVVKRFGMAIAGFFAMTALIVGWFALRGTLEEMLDATFWFNLRYIEDASAQPKATAYLGTVALAGTLTLAAASAQLLRFGLRGSTWAVVTGLGAASTVAVLSPATSYAHYLTLILPMMALGAVMLLHALGARMRGILALVIVMAASAVTMYQVPKSVQYARAVHLAESAYQAQLEDVLSDVANDRRQEVFPWSLPATYYLMTDTLPTYKYFITQQWWGSVDPQVTADTVAHIAQVRPGWVLTPAGGATDERLQRLLDGDYLPARSNNRFQLFELR